MHSSALIAAVAACLGLAAPADSVAACRGHCGRGAVRAHARAHIPERSGRIITEIPAPRPNPTQAPLPRPDFPARQVPPGYMAPPPNQPNNLPPVFAPQPVY
jgi:hypothetical protein